MWYLFLFKDNNEIKQLESVGKWADRQVEEQTEEGWDKYWRADWLVNWLWQTEWSIDTRLTDWPIHWLTSRKEKKNARAKTTIDLIVTAFLWGCPMRQPSLDRVLLECTLFIVMDSPGRGNLQWNFDLECCINGRRSAHTVRGSIARVVRYT